MKTMRVQINYFNSKKELKTKFLSIEELFALILSDKYHQACHDLSYKLATIPNIHPGSTMEDADRLPVVRFAQGEEGQYTGYVLLSFKTPDADAKEQIGKRARILPQTLMIFEGSSRKSMKVVVAFTLPDGSLPSGTETEEPDGKAAELFHQHAYYMAARFYEAQLGAVAERKPPRIDRGCRIPSDRDAFLNADVKPMMLSQPTASLTETVSKGMIRDQGIAIRHTLPNYDDEMMKALKFQYCYKGVREEEPLDPDANETDLFVMRLAKECLKNGIDEEFAIRRLLHITPYYEMEQLVRACFRSVYANGEPGGSCAIPESTIQMSLLMDFLKRRYQFRRNAMTGANEYIEEGKYMFEWSPLTKEVMNRITIEALNEGIMAWDKDVKRYVESTFVCEFNPVNDYMNSLPVWDGKDRIMNLAARVPTMNRRWADFFHTWLLAMVSQWTGMHKIHGNAMVPLLIGAQGDGKSTFCKLLLPEKLRNYYTDRLDFSNKNDAERALTRFALINIDEFDSITKRQQSFLKHILQKSSVMGRQVYSSIIKDNKRWAAFIGTTNDPCPLSDPTGSRRYLCIRTCGKIDTATPVDYPQLYAQLKCELGAGYRSWFTGEEEAEIQKSNTEFQQFDSLEEEFLTLFGKPKDDREGMFMKISAIVRTIKSKYRSIKEDTTTYQKLGRILSRTGFRHRHTMKGNEYLVTRLKDDGAMTDDEGNDIEKPP